MLILISVSPPIQQWRLMLALASFDKLWKFTARFNMYTFLLRCKLKPEQNFRNPETF